MTYLARFSAAGQAERSFGLRFNKKIIKNNVFTLFQTIDDPSTLGYYPVSEAVLGNGIIDIRLSDILR